MAEELRVYDGAEREQVFVKRYERNPGLGSRTARGGIDNRPYRTTAQWSHCVRRHRSYWRDRGVSGRSIPDFRFEGEEGWWFPAAWIVEFAQGSSRWPQQQGAAA